MTIGTRIKMLRETAQLSQEYVAAAIGVSQSTLCNIESDRTNIRFLDLLKITKILKSDITAFVPDDYQCCFTGAGLAPPAPQAAAAHLETAGNQVLVSELKKEIMQQLLCQQEEIKNTLQLILREHGMRT